MRVCVHLLLPTLLGHPIPHVVAYEVELFEEEEVEEEVLPPKVKVRVVLGKVTVVVLAPAAPVLEVPVAVAVVLLLVVDEVDDVLEVLVAVLALAVPVVVPVVVPVLVVRVPPVEEVEVKVDVKVEVKKVGQVLKPVLEVGKRVIVAPFGRVMTVRVWCFLSVSPSRIGVKEKINLR